MDHATIEAEGLIDRYHRGDLPAALEERFEAHALECPDCLGDLEAARAFQRGLKDAVAEDAMRAAVVQRGLAGWLARRRGLALGLVAVLAAATPAFWLLRENRMLKAGGDAGVTAGVEVNTPVFLLQRVRGEDPVPAIELPPEAARFALAVDIGLEAFYQGYRATVVDRQGGTLWQGDGLQPNALEVLLITFPVASVPAGEHRLVIEGLEGDKLVELGRYPFRMP